MKYFDNKAVLVVCCLLFLSYSASSQEVSMISSLNHGQLERFIQLAKDNFPQRKVLALNEEKARSIYRAQPIGYLDIFNVSYFYRPEERSAVNPENPYIVNGFQYGINVNVSSILQRPFLTKQAKADYKITQLEREAYDRTLENEVKRRYYEYVRVLEDLKIKSQALGDSKVLLTDVQNQFELGESDLETYSTIKAQVSFSQAELLEVEMALLLARDALEEIIGVKLTDLEK